MYLDAESFMKHPSNRTPAQKKKLQKTSTTWNDSQDY
jgi:hypothetical protein